MKLKTRKIIKKTKADTMLKDQTINLIEQMILQSYRKGVIVMVESPTDTYFEINLSIIKLLMNKGFQGIYISFQRPFKNVSSIFKTKGININELLFIDTATAFSGEQQHDDMHCINVSQALDIDELVKAIYTSMPKLNSQKKFIFIDSLTTIALYKPFSEIMRFSEFLMGTVRKVDVGNIILIFNVAKDLAQKKFIRDVAFRVDRVITVDNNE